MAYVPIKYLRVTYINTSGTPTEMLVTNNSVKKGRESVYDFTESMAMTYSKAIEKALRNVRWSHDVNFDIQINQLPDHMSDFWAIYTDGSSIRMSKATIQRIDVPESQDKGEVTTKVYSFSYYDLSELKYAVTNKIGTAKEIALPGVSIKTHQLFLVVACDVISIVEALTKQTAQPPLVTGLLTGE